MQSISERQPKPRGKNGQDISVRDTEGATDVENYILACWRNRENEDEIANSNVLNQFSRKLFGVSLSDAQLEMTIDLRKRLDTLEKEEQWEELREEFNSQFRTNDSTDDKAVKILLKLGVDFRSAEGHPLNMTRYLKRQAEAAALGIMGKLPDPETLQIERWTANLLDKTKM